jgi:hypothetical protein
MGIDLWLHVAAQPGQPGAMDDPDGGGRSLAAREADELAKRLRRIEESCAQASYDQDQLSAHVRELMQAIERATARVARLERMIAGLSGGGAGSDAAGEPGNAGAGPVAEIGTALGPKENTPP